ncbi:MAG: hypothetical protein V4813_09835 [Gemmatimonadota bacterium]
MPHLNRRGLLRRSALAAGLLALLPLTVSAQVRRPDPVPSGRRAPAGVPARRTEIVIGAGTVALDPANATKSSMLIGSIALRRQHTPAWLMLGGAIDIGRTTIDGEYFPYERRLVGDTTQFVSVDGNATMFAARLTADALTNVGDSKKYRAGGGISAGVYAMMPSPAGGAGAGTFVAPTFGVSGTAAADLTRRFGASATLGFTQFVGFDRDKLRPSDPAKEDPVFTTPFTPPPEAVKSFGGLRLVVGVTYRLGVKPVSGGTK